MHNRSFFQDDLLDKLLKKILGKKFYKNPLVIFLFSVFVIWLPNYILFLIDRMLGYEAKTYFLEDYASYAQYIVGVTLFLFVRNLLNSEWMQIVETIENSQMLNNKQKRELEVTIKKIKKILYCKWLNIIVIVLTYAAMVWWVLFETTSGKYTWKAHPVPGQDMGVMTLNGWYSVIVSFALYIFLIIYFGIKYFAWVYFLFKLSRLKPKVIGYHPDKTGGLHFLTRTVNSFGLFVFTLGIVQMATALYKMQIEHYDLMSAEIIVTLFLYMILAPLFFIFPMFLFTKQMFVAKQNAVKEFNEIGYDICLNITTKTRITSKNNMNVERTESFSSLTDLSQSYEIIKGMRLWPMDLSSITRLFISSIAPMLPIILKFTNIPESISSILNAIFK